MVANQSGSLWWPSEKLLCVSNIHLAKSDTQNKAYKNMLPPFHTQESLARLGDEIKQINPVIVICLGNSFDELKSLDSLHSVDHKRLAALTAGRRWVWIDGDSNAGPVDLGGSHHNEFRHKHLSFRNQATHAGVCEISGHHNPSKILNENGISTIHRCFAVDDNRIILPAFSQGDERDGTKNTTLDMLMGDNAIAITLGREIKPVLMK
ncbi:metallophosphoesterase [Amylibacter ulvae]|uniref:Metallophosphoesterase n=2 Tax=Paramylibacter ulvae TaxID=1651968 RepID=A0ABQ3CZ26_9RHOB|nr:metallophosphoesterase [Amylibacter ulvae]